MIRYNVYISVNSLDVVVAGYDEKDYSGHHGYLGNAEVGHANNILQYFLGNNSWYI